MKNIYNNFKSKNTTSENLNILFIKRHSFPDGLATAKRHKYFIDYLNIKGISSGAIQTRTKDDPFKNPTRGKYGNCEYFNANHLWKRNIIGKITYLVKIFSFILQFKEKQKLNIIVFSTIVYIDVLPFYLFAKLLNYYFVFDVVENYSVEGSSGTFFSRLSYRISKQLYKKSTCIFVISSQIETYIRTLAPNVPVFLMPNSTTINDPVKKDFFSDPIKILYLGTFAAKDGVSYLIDGYKKFLKETSLNSTLILAGYGNKNDLAEILPKVLDNKAINYLGFIPENELTDLIYNCDILTMTRNNSHFANNGFPFKLSEYLASGNITIATEVGDIKKYLEHKQNSYLIPPEDDEEICNALKFITENQKESLKIGYRGYKTAKRYFNPDINGAEFVSFILKAIESPKNYRKF